MRLGQGLANDGLQAISSLFFIDKISLEHSHTHSFTFCLRQLLLWKSKLNSQDRDYRAHKDEKYYHLAFFKRFFLFFSFLFCIGV